MKCPICVTTDLLMTERQGIEIDYCAQCRGVWLDRGELDKIIERSMREAVPNNIAASPTSPTVQSPQVTQPYYDERHGHHEKHRYDNHGYARKKSIWKELFD
jgi:Zn-finger nucleic acid-binding protein